MTEQQKQHIKEEAHSIINNMTLVDKMAYLKGRWLDERAYEDFNDYISTMKQEVENQGYKFVDMNKRFHLTLSGKHATYLLKLVGNTLSIGLTK